MTCPVEATPGDRLILTVAGLSCGAVETVEDWAGESSEVGLAYVGLPEDAAVDAIEADGYRSRVVGRDGIGYAVTADAALRRFDLSVYDGVVVAAAGVGDTVHSEPRIAEPLAVVLVTSSSSGVLEGAGDVTVVVGDEGVQLPWQQGPVGGSVSIVFRDLPAGAATLELQGQMCTMGFDLTDAGTVVTIEVGPDGTVDQRECPATVETLDEHLAEVTADWDRHDPAEGYTGLTEAEAVARAEAEGRSVRVVDRDGVSSALTDDLRPDRVNLVLFDDEVRAAAIF